MLGKGTKIRKAKTPIIKLFLHNCKKNLQYYKIHLTLQLNIIITL